MKWAVLVLALATPGVWAEKADRDKPMHIESDALRYDDLKQISVFTGNVVITKGTLIVRGAQVEVRQDPQGYQFATATGSADKLAFYRRKRDQADEYIEGQAQTIEYDDKTDTVKFIKQALLRRYSGVALIDETTGGLIVYYNQTNVFTVEGQGAGRNENKGRVRTQLSPRNEQVTPGTSASPAAGAVLRPSVNMGGSKK